MHFGVGQLSVFIVATNKQGSNFFKWANPGLFLVYFWSFQTNSKNFTTNQCEKMSCPSSIWHRDSNPRPLEYESSPITTRQMLVFFINVFLSSTISKNFPKRWF